MPAPEGAQDPDGVPKKWIVIMNGRVNQRILKKEGRLLPVWIRRLQRRGTDKIPAGHAYLLLLCTHAMSWPAPTTPAELRPTNGLPCCRGATNIAPREPDDVVKNREAEAAEMKRLDAAFGKQAPISDTRQWKSLKEQKKLPANEPDWHLGKLKPWQGPDAMALGKKYRANAASIQDPFKKVFELEEACKMFNKVLEIEPKNEEARAQLSQTCAAMNNEYVRMKGIKKQMKAANFETTQYGDFLQSKNGWVKATRAPH
eukprot:gene21255-28173_t